MSPFHLHCLHLVLETNFKLELLGLAIVQHFHRETKPEISCLNVIGTLKVERNG